MKEKSMLDGSGIRAAREAQGMTQTELAERVGTRQQTIEKIELGKVNRTTYLPEIHRVLAVGGERTIGAVLNSRRLDAGFSMDELARKMGFAGQSSIQRYLMPDYDLELRPDIARKFDAALGSAAPAISGISPLMVLRTILCANPTAEQIEAALAANGFRIVPVEGNFPTTEIADDPKAFVLDVMHRHNLTPGALAGKVGISASTLTRAFNDPGHKFKFSVGTIQKIREWDRAETEPQRIHQA